ncbi:MAG: UDP-3-O-(3-hydroxymyristoyl)glucosamine N-acyltransferase [Gemmatimonadaceae bacterium]|nr:UDP-3-O-(3-hydroxymyristoyl)glucosamine N-acyltransferase [Gemmatimonadaceae bacterium]
MRIRLSDLASLVTIDIVRDGAFSTLGAATSGTADTLVFVEEPRWLRGLQGNPHVSSVLTTPALASQVPDGVAVAVCASPRRAFFELHNLLARTDGFYWTDFATEVDPTARIHPRAYVAERNVRIGAGCVVEPNATVLERSVLGAGVVLRSGCTIGSQGFEFKRVDGRILAVTHAGGVRLGDAVEVQANSAISRAVFGGFTELGSETKLDNLVHVAHNVRIGRRCLLAASAMIAGSATLGDDVWVGPGVSVSSGVTVGDGATLTIGAVVTRDVDPGQRVTGNFAVDHARFLSHLRTLR